MRCAGRGAAAGVLPAAAFGLFSVSALARVHPQGLAAGVLAKLWMRVSKP